VPNSMPIRRRGARPPQDRDNVRRADEDAQFQAELAAAIRAHFRAFR